MEYYLTQASSSNLSSALQGKVSGVEISPSSGMPGASSKMTIRGSRHPAQHILTLFSLLRYPLLLLQLRQVP